MQRRTDEKLQILAGTIGRSPIEFSSQVVKRSEQGYVYREWYQLCFAVLDE